jgi:hypothetical protein
MGRITLDHGLKSKLNGLTEPMELADESGQTIGHFLPSDHYQQLLYRLAEAQCPYTREQLEKMRQEEGGQTLSDFWKTLGQS